MIAENKNSPNGLDREQLDFTKIDDVQLFAMCKRFGEQARIWRQKFAGLLPEVLKRRLYERKGFESIFVFAKKLAGMSEEQVRRVLNLEQKFEDKPVLKNLLLNGEISANKLARIASIATPENQEFLANQSKILSNRALETLVKDEKFAQETLNRDLQNLPDPKSQNGSQEPLFEQKSVHVHTNSTGIFEDVKLLQKFSPELKTKLKELDEKGLDINQILLELLQKRDEEIAMEKEQLGEAIVAKQLAEEALAKQAEDQAANAQGNIVKKSIELSAKKPSSYINVATKNLLKKEFGDKCSIPGCNNLAKPTHHTQRFGLSHNNDPRFLAPVCEQHHEIAHSIDQKYQYRRARAIEL
ncbi:MAG: hypothetical protein WC843_02555 [Candidatus Gracilibacteria bacterium]|jgi:hypothetical protein